MKESEAKANIIAYATSEAENLPIGIGKAFDVAMQALEKQIPKKMVIKNDNGRPRRACGGCGCFVLPASRFCSKCGQKLDWSDEE